MSRKTMRLMAELHALLGEPDGAEVAERIARAEVIGAAMLCVLKGQIDADLVGGIVQQLRELPADARARVLAIGPADLMASAAELPRRVEGLRLVLRAIATHMIG